MEGVGSPPRGARRIGRLSQCARHGWEVHPVDCEGSRGPPGGMGGVERDRRCQEDLRESQ